jgi:hypothetical protein
LFDGVHALGHIDHLAANEPPRRIVELIAVLDLEPDILAVPVAVARDCPLAESRPAEHLHPVGDRQRAVVGMDELERLLADQIVRGPAQNLGHRRAQCADDRDLVAVHGADARAEQRRFVVTAVDRPVRSDENAEIDAEAMPGVQKVHRHFVVGLVPQVNDHPGGASQASALPRFDDRRKIAGKTQFECRSDAADRLPGSERNFRGHRDAQARLLRRQHAHGRVHRKERVNNRVDARGVESFERAGGFRGIEARGRLHISFYRPEAWLGASRSRKIFEPGAAA